MEIPLIDVHAVEGVLKEKDDGKGWVVFESKDVEEKIFKLYKPLREYFTRNSWLWHSIGPGNHTFCLARTKPEGDFVVTRIDKIYTGYLEDHWNTGNPKTTPTPVAPDWGLIEPKGKWGKRPMWVRIGDEDVRLNDAVAYDKNGHPILLSTLYRAYCRGEDSFVVQISDFSVDPDTDHDAFMFKFVDEKLLRPVSEDVVAVCSLHRLPSKIKEKGCFYLIKIQCTDKHMNIATSVTLVRVKEFDRVSP